MTKKFALRATTALTALCVATTIEIAPVAAQDDELDTGAMEQVTITGTFIRRKGQADSASPISVLGSEDLSAIGAQTISDITQTLTINTGAENSPDAFTQNGTSGTESINLRGLGLASTLILLNGKRQVVSGGVPNTGVNFVDTASLVPAIAIDRVDILKDGAAALYGSDAVAGVVNFFTRDNFEGLELSADYRAVAGTGDSSDIRIQGLVGGGNDRAHVIAAVSYLDRTPLTTAEKRLSRPQDDTSALGNPGAFFIGLPVPAINPSTGLPVIDPETGLIVEAIGANTPFIDPTGCSEQGGFRLPPPGFSAPIPTPLGDIGFCGFDFGEFFNLIAEETRLQGFARGTYDITDTITFKGEFGFTRNRTSRGNSPTFPILTFPTVGPANPGYVFGGVPGIFTNPVTGEQSIVFNSPVAFFGRAVGNGGEVSPNRFTNDTFRVSAGFEGIIDDNWFWEINYTRGINDFSVRTRDTLAVEFQNALNGLGGPNCDVLNGTPGVGDCMFFNPFATSFGPIPNDPSVIEAFTGEQVGDVDSDLTVVDALITGDVADLPAGPLGIAVGFQYRDERFARDFDSASNQDRFAFLIGNPDTVGTRDVVAFFAELAIPVMENLDLQAALRYEDYGGQTGDTLDPKIALLYRPTDWLTMRGSWGTSFRAPSIFQQTGTDTSLQQVSDPITGGTFFAAVRTTGNPNLLPEESTAWNFGITAEPTPGLEINIDYWRFDFTDVIIQENFQAILNAFPQDPTRVIRAGDPLLGPVIQINTNFDNASSVETDGIDFSVKYTVESGNLGTFIPGIEGTYILNYDLVDPQAGAVDGAGRRNFTNFGTSTPEWRFNVSLLWFLNEFSGNIFVRYIDGYDDDQVISGVENGVVDSHLTVDAQLNFDIGAWVGHEEGAVISVGATNLFDEDPPFVATNGGFDSKVHDPRGRLVYIRGTVGF